MAHEKLKALSAQQSLQHEDAPPAYAVASGSASPPAEISQPHTRHRELIFPKKFGFYLPKPPRQSSNVLGPHRNQPLYALDWKGDSNPGALKGTDTDLRLYDFIALDQTKALASVVFGRAPDRGLIDGQVTLHTHQGGEVTERFTGSMVKNKMHVFVSRFSIETDIAGRREVFEWRDSGHPNLKAVLDTRCIGGGWKLLRMSTNASIIDNKGPEDWTSDGKEVVAACSGTNGSFTKFWTGAFLGIGATGALGRRWELMVVMTMYMLMSEDVRRRQD